MIRGAHILLLFAALPFANGINAQNRSLAFNGTTNKVVVANHADFDFTTQFTLEAWIYAENWKDQSYQGSVINKDAEMGGIQSGYSMRIGAGRLEGIITPGWGGTVTGAVMKEKKWNHVAMVFKDGEMWLYINGTLQAFKGGLPTRINASHVDLLIGESPGFPGRVWDGRIDEVRIWSVFRSAHEIRQNMSISLTGTEKGLVAYYDFDEEDASNKLRDKTANAHHGTLADYGSNYSWTDGYKLNQNDIALTGILSPADHPDWSNAEQVKVEVQNTAFNSVSDFDVAFEYKGTVYTETIKDTLKPWTKYIYTFNKFIDLKSKDKGTIKAYVAWDADTDAENNMLQKSFKRTRIIGLMDRVQHNFSDKGQSHSNTLSLPEGNSDYGQLLLHISVDCPAGGCDPWDMVGNVKIKKDGREYEIGRFITPYGKACGPWTIDVSDFRSILCGSIDVLSYIEVWGSSGWLLTLDLEYVEGELEYPFTKVVPLYEIDRQVYGDPFNSCDLPEKTVSIPANTQLAHIRMTNTGHGQANTNNAAEFMEANHHIRVNGIEKFTHHLWKEDCNQNSCSPQFGSWQYSRAGWCPGQQVDPAWFNIADVLTPGEDMLFDYVLEDYVNLLNTNYNGGSHTEPFYKIYSYLILSSDSPFENYMDLVLDSVSLHEGAGQGTKKICMEFSNKGSVDIESIDFGYVLNNAEGANETVNIALAPGEESTYEFVIADFEVNQSGLLVAYAQTESDKNTRNNIRAIGFGTYNIAERSVYPGLKIFPLPFSDVLNIESEMRIENIRILTVDGRLMKQWYSGSQQASADLSDLKCGVYFVSVKLENSMVISEYIIKK